MSGTNKGGGKVQLRLWMQVKTTSSPSDLRCLQINLRHSRISSSLAQLLLDFNIDVVFIQEPYAISSPIGPVVANVPQGYTPFHSLTNADHAYGAAVLIREPLAADARLDVDLSSSQAACVRLSRAYGDALLVSLYLRPSVSDVSPLLLPILSGPALSRMVLAMDSNGRNPLWGSPTTDGRGQELEGMLAAHGLSLANRPPALLDFVPTGTSFVDLTLTGGGALVPRWLFLPIPSLSDHPYIYFDLRLARASRGPPPKGGTTRIPHISDIDLDVFKHNIRVSSSSFLPDMPTRPSPADIDYWIDALARLIASASIGSRKPWRPRGRNMPWWSRELCAMRTKARVRYRAWSAARGQPNEEELRTDHNKSKSAYQRALRTAKRRAWLEFSASKTGGEVYAALRRLSGGGPSNSLPDRLLVDGKTVTGPKEVIRACAEHFFPPCPPSGPAHKNVERRVGEALASDMGVIPPITFCELASALGSLKGGSAPGPDGIAPALVQAALPIIKEDFLAILNACLREGHFPGPWKISRAVIIGKPNKTSYDSLGSFRPICLASCLGKVLEGVLLARLTWHSEAGGWLSPSQHGFRAGRSTETAAHCLTSFVEGSFERGEVTACAFLDIKAAFDSVWHPSILDALLERACPLYLVKMIDGFLTGRSVVISHGGSTNSFPVRLGCPQGSILSPSLWNITMDKILRLGISSSALLLGYADDVAAASAARDAKTALRGLQTICDAVVGLCYTLKLVLNALKTVLVFFSRRTEDYSDIRLIIDGVPIASSAVASYLGLTLDSKLRWKGHIKEKCLAAKRALFSAHAGLRATWGFGGGRLRHFYRTAVEPIALYCSSVWASSLKAKTTARVLRSLQRAALVLITNASRTAATESLLVLSGMLPLDLQIAGQAASRLLFFQNEGIPFCPSSKKFLIHSFPEIQRLRGPERQVNLLAHRPPWRDVHSVVRLHQQDEHVSLAPSGPRSLRLYLGQGRCQERAGYAFLAADSAGMVSAECGSFPQHATGQQMAGYALHRALLHALSMADKRAAFEIFGSFDSTFFMERPSRTVSRGTLDIIGALDELAGRVTLFHIGGKAHSPGSVDAHKLAVAGALAGRPVDILPTRKILRARLHNMASSRWNEEWRTSKKGVITKLFFPLVPSFGPLDRRPLSRQHTQILTGHSLLSAHQFKIGSVPSPTCECGLAPETVEHFLLSCNRFDRQRTGLRLRCGETGMGWPPSLSDLYADETAWSQMLNFVSKTGRLARQGPSATTS